MVYLENPANHMRLALFEPDIPANTGTMLRLSACLGVAADIIEPCGFAFSVPAFRRAGMDYLDHANICHHLSWPDFRENIRAINPRPRLVLLTTRAACPYTALSYRADDILMVGRESSGVPDEVHAEADERVLVPMRPGLRSLNVAVAAAMVLGEALRQTSQFPDTLLSEAKRHDA